MKIAASSLRRFVEIPSDPRELRHLLDDVGVEVKRLEHVDGDVHLTLELLANRGDHHCYEGVAREISGRTGAVVRLPDVTPLVAGASPVGIEIESPGCLVYTATLLECDPGSSGRLDADAAALLEAAGLNAVRPAVDATNIANLELGQPTHAFDADTLVGPITVRASRAGEQAWPLFQPEPIELPEGLLVIADDVKILAIAGVIGCEESKTHEHTRRLLLESACFDPVSVRKSARSLGIFTDSSARFERGSDPTHPLLGAGRVVHLLYGAGWRLVGESGVAGAWSDPRRQIPLHIPTAAAFLEHPLTEAEIRERLGRYGFVVSPTWPEWDEDDGWDPPDELLESGKDRLRMTVLVQVPPGRSWDVEFAADLYEELAKSIGYGQASEQLPSVGLGSVPTRPERVRAAVDEILVSNGFFGVITDGFYGRDTRERLRLDEHHVLWNHVETKNALDRAYSLVKNNALDQAVAVVAYNLSMRTTEVKAFEWTRTFHPDKTAPNNVCTERELVWWIASGSDTPPSWARVHRPADALFFKGLVREIAVQLGLELTVVPGRSSHPLSSCLHPNRQATVRYGGVAVGILGEVHPAVVAAHKIKRARPVYAELELEPLLAERAPRHVEEAPSVHPILRSLAFALPGHLEAGKVSEVMRRAAPPWLDDVQVTDLFETEQVGVPVRAITWSLRFSQQQGQRSADEVNRACEAIVAAIHEELGQYGVVQR